MSSALFRLSPLGSALFFLLADSLGALQNAEEMYPRFKTWEVKEEREMERREIMVTRC